MTSRASQLSGAPHCSHACTLHRSSEVSCFPAPIGIDGLHAPPTLHSKLDLAGSFDVSMYESAGCVDMRYPLSAVSAADALPGSIAGSWCPGAWQAAVAHCQPSLPIIRAW